MTEKKDMNSFTLTQNRETDEGITSIALKIRKAIDDDDGFDAINIDALIADLEKTALPGKALNELKTRILKALSTKDDLLLSIDLKALHFSMVEFRAYYENTENYFM
jgi:hypothetical protein